MRSTPNSESSSTPKKVTSKDHYDRARQGRDIMNNAGASGELPDAVMANFLAACTIVDALLAVADAIYVGTGQVRWPVEDDSKKE